jgi:hypothetical protein
MLGVNAATASQVEGGMVIQDTALRIARRQMDMSLPDSKLELSTGKVS